VKPNWKIILKIYNKHTTYTGTGGANGINLYVFIMALCCTTTVLDLPEATGDRLGWTGTPFVIPFLFQRLRPLRLSGQFWRPDLDVLRPLSWVCMRAIMNMIRWSPISFQ